MAFAERSLKASDEGCVFVCCFCFISLCRFRFFFSFFSFAYDFFLVVAFDTLQIFDLVGSLFRFISCQTRMHITLKKTSQTDFCVCIKWYKLLELFNAAWQSKRHKYSKWGLCGGHIHFFVKTFKIFAKPEVD